MKSVLKSLPRAALVVGIAAALGLAWNAVRPRGIPLRYAAPAPGGEGGPGSGERFYDTTKTLPPSDLVSVDRAYEIWREGVVLMVDSRRAFEFEAMHIPGARNINAGSSTVFARDIARHQQWLTQKLEPALAKEFPDGIPVIVYCNNPYCDQAVTALHLLRDSPLGLKNIRVMKEGLDGWKRRGHPVVVPIPGPDGKPVRGDDGELRTREVAGRDIPRLADTGLAWLPPGALFALLLVLPWAVIGALAAMLRGRSGLLIAGIDGMSLVLRVGLGAMFVIAAWYKLQDPTGFGRMVACYDILPLPIVPVFTVALPAVEALAGLLLIVGLGTRPSALILAGLLLVFLAAVYSLLARNLNCICGCFPGEYPANWARVSEDAAFLFAALLVYWRGGRRLALDRPGRSDAAARPA
jgi:putative oxidoreductase